MLISSPWLAHTTKMSIKNEESKVGISAFLCWAWFQKTQIFLLPMEAQRYSHILKSSSKFRCESIVSSAVKRPILLSCHSNTFRPIILCNYTFDNFSVNIRKKNIGNKSRKVQLSTCPSIMTGINSNRNESEDKECGFLDRFFTYLSDIGTV